MAAPIKEFRDMVASLSLTSLTIYPGPRPATATGKCVTLMAYGGTPPSTVPVHSMAVQVMVYEQSPELAMNAAWALFNGLNHKAFTYGSAIPANTWVIAYAQAVQPPTQLPAEGAQGRELFRAVFNLDITIRAK